MELVNGLSLASECSCAMGEQQRAQQRYVWRTSKQADMFCASTLAYLFYGFLSLKPDTKIDKGSLVQTDIRSVSALQVLHNRAVLQIDIYLLIYLLIDIHFMASLSLFFRTWMRYEIKTATRSSDIKEYEPCTIMALKPFKLQQEWQQTKMSK